MSRRFDAVVVGAGQSGPALGARLAASGLSVAVVERKLVGGTCVNVGCMPTKTMVASARVAAQARRRATYGVGTGAVTVDMAVVQARAAKVIADARTGLEDWIAGTSGMTLLRGHARLEGPRTLRVGDETIEAERIFLNVGGRAVIPDLPGAHDVGALTSSDMIGLTAVPEHLLVVGGSYIGLEFAQMFRRFGAEVTVIETGPRLIGREDPEISDAIREIMEADGIAVRTGATCIRLAREAGRVTAQVDCQAGPPALSGSHVLLATGRRPNTDDLGLEAAGVETDKRGYVTVGEDLQTNVPGIWALGDCNGRGAFTHTSWDDNLIVAANLLDGGSRRVSDRVLGYALYIDPPLGRVGMTEAQAGAAGHKLLVASRPMTRVGRAIEKGETRGLMKLVVDADSRAILGAAILGPGGDEAIQVVQALMHARAPVDTLATLMPIHPTVAELLPTLAQGLREPEGR